MDAKAHFVKAIRMSKSIKTNPIKNIWMDFFIDSFKLRMAKRQKIIIIIMNYLTLICKVTLVLINSIGLFIKWNREVSLLLFDVSVLVGGIEVYMRIIIILLMILAIFLNYEFRINSYEEMSEWLQLFDICRSRVRRLFFFKGYDNRILFRLIRAMKIIYKITNVLIFLLSKYSFSNIKLISTQCCSTDP